MNIRTKTQPVHRFGKKSSEHLDHPAHVKQYIDDYQDCLEACLSRDLIELAILSDSARQAIQIKSGQAPASTRVFPFILPFELRTQGDLCNATRHAEAFVNSVPGPMAYIFRVLFERAETIYQDGGVV